MRLCLVYTLCSYMVSCSYKKNILYDVFTVKLWWKSWEKNWLFYRSNLIKILYHLQIKNIDRSIQYFLFSFIIYFIKTTYLNKRYNIFYTFNRMKIEWNSLRPRSFYKQQIHEKKGWKGLSSFNSKQKSGLVRKSIFFSHNNISLWWHEKSISFNLFLSLWFI